MYAVFADVGLLKEYKINLISRNGEHKDIDVTDL
jgi:hypothetical protein